MDEQVRGYLGLCEQAARKLVGRNGAEFDDLVQEGLISAWWALKHDIVPSASIVELRMLQYVRWLGRHPGGLTGLGADPDTYPEMLSLDMLIGTPDEPSA